MPSGRVLDGGFRQDCLGLVHAGRVSRAPDAFPRDEIHGTSGVLVGSRPTPASAPVAFSPRSSWTIAWRTARMRRR